MKCSATAADSAVGTAAACAGERKCGSPASMLLLAFGLTTDLLGKYATGSAMIYCFYFFSLSCAALGESVNFGKDFFRDAAVGRLLLLKVFILGISCKGFYRNELEQVFKRVVKNKWYVLKVVRSWVIFFFSLFYKSFEFRSKVTIFYFILIFFS